MLPVWADPEGQFEHRASRLGRTCGGYARRMSDRPSDNDPTSADPAVVGVPQETPDAVRPSTTGLVAGPVEGPTDVSVDRPYRSPINDTEARYGTDESPC